MHERHVRNTTNNNFWQATSPTFHFSTTRPQALVDHFRSANFISQSKYCLKACNFRIKPMLPAEEARAIEHPPPVIKQLCDR